MSDGCYYGMGFGSEGDGVELMDRAAVARTIRDEYAAQARGWLTVENLPHKGVRIERVWWNGQLMYSAPQAGSFENIQWPQFTFETKESTAKPSLPALTRQAGEKYKGLGFCDSTP